MSDMSFHLLFPAIQHCAEYAVQSQSKVVRTYKNDGSVLTSTDLYISEYLIHAISQLFPESNIISEETKTPFSSDAPYTFVLDPIDGTDVYSQGLPSWCIALGILDNDLQPIGGIISAPRWGLGTTEGLMVYTFPGTEVIVNGTTFAIQKDFSSINQLVISSRAYEHLDFTGINGKLRSFGSTILHILAPALLNHIQAAIFSGCYIWDIAAAHAIVRACGLSISYLSGEPLTYGKLIHRELSSDYAIAGTQDTIEYLRSAITRRDTH